MQFQYDDGGRSAAGYKGKTGDCVTRSIAIAAQLPYQTVYDAINAGGENENRSARSKTKSNARTGVNTKRKWFQEYLKSLGWTWTATMQIGSGCKVHLQDGELPMGRLIVRVSKHFVAIIDGVIHDTGDCSRNGNRCVYGYWHKNQPIT